MINSISKIFLFSAILLLPLTTSAWNAVGHRVVANIAYQHLQPEVRKKVDGLVTVLKQEYDDMTSFQHLSYWPDTLRAQKIETYTHWHYINAAFSNDGSPLKNMIDTDNAVWAIKNIQPVVKNARANPYERARFLAFLIHIVGDLHQPLHSASYISASHPDGDRGGNDYFVRYNNKRVNLHQLWDQGINAFTGENNTEQVNVLTESIMALYPKNYFGDKVNNLDPDDWVKDGLSNAKNYVYSTPENETLSPTYIATGKQIVEQETALAGYRLAILLNQLLA